MEVAARGVLLDVEGTTSAVAYVYDVMFPFARKAMPDYVERHWSTPAMLSVRQRLRDEAADPAIEADSAKLIAYSLGLMDADVKSTGLKELQGLVWEAGFRSGDLVAHVFDDVAPCFRAWLAGGLSLRIYSSGSVHAQRLFFGHSLAGDLLPLLDGHYDTTTGPKREAASYAAIAADWQLAPADILFLSDIPAELVASRDAGMQVALVRRPGNAPVEQNLDLPTIGSFAELSIRPI